MIWGSLSAQGRSSLWFIPPNTTINGNVYLTILQEKLPVFMQLSSTNIFQHDGAPCHRTKKVSAWLLANGYEILGSWPGNSTDLNPIENPWAIVKRSVPLSNSSSAEDLKKAIMQVWTQEITPEHCATLVKSMPKRIQEVIRLKGLHSHY